VIAGGDRTEPSRRDLEAARLELLRRRVWWFRVALAVVLVAGVVFAWLVATRWQGRVLGRPEILGLLATCFMAVALVVVPWARGRLWPGTDTLERIIRRVTLTVIFAVFGQSTAAALLASAITRVAREFHAIDPTGSVGPAVPAIGFFLLSHTTASILIPWTVREALRPLLILVAIQVVVTFFLASDSPQMARLGLLMLLAAGVPGILITALRTGRFRERVGMALMRSSYSEVQRELATARRIHERLFPRPGAYGGLVLAYRYEPTRQIGGDYADLTTAADGSATIVVVDVTGHGIPAALAVNRIHGEIKRVMRESTTASPRELVAALGHYIHLTLADETVFATVIAMRIDPVRGRLDYCNAGHPPAMVLRRDPGGGAGMERLDSTAMMLGPLSAQELAPEQRSVAISPGDVIVAYTDGAFECQDAQGRQLGLERLGAAVAAAAGRSRDPERIVAEIEARVRAHRAGPPEDDTLVLAIALAEGVR
jgi:serine phosphatase RsbU (regulator of sigma subunit)